AYDRTRTEPAEALNELSRRKPPLQEVRAGRDPHPGREKAEIPGEEERPIDEPELRESPSSFARRLGAAPTRMHPLTLARARAGCPEKHASGDQERKSTRLNSS